MSSLPNYEVNNASAPCRSPFTDLGLKITTPGSCNAHIDAVVAKAFAKLGIINKVFSTKLIKSMLTLYKYFVRPALEYGSIVWNPHTVSNIDKIERVQRRMFRIIPDIQRLSYTEIS